MLQIDPAPRSTPYRHSVGLTEAWERKLARAVLARVNDHKLKLITNLAPATGLTKAAAHRVLAALPELILEMLLNGERVVFPGLGEFRIITRHYAARVNACGNLPAHTVHTLHLKLHPKLQRRLRTAKGKGKRKLSP